MTEVTTPARRGSPGAAESGEGAADQAKEKASEAAGQAKEQVQQATGQAKDKVREQVDQRSTQAGEQVSSTAGDIRSVGEQLREQGKDKPAQFADQAAERVERLGSYLTESDADRILHDAEDFARRQPWAVALGGVALGFAASRFLKASSSERYQSRYSGNGSSPAPRSTTPRSTTPVTTPLPAGTPVTGDPAGPAGQGLPGTPA
jgi:uncharacterized protein YjbJ (UPF0337 family)